jgi:hypothetical protein
MPDMNSNVEQGSYYGPKDLLVCRPNHTGKPTSLEKHEIPKFSHRLNPSDTT